MKNLKLSTKIISVSIFILLIFSLASFGILFRALSNQASGEMDQLLHNETLALSSFVNATVDGEDFEFEMHSKFLSQYHQHNPNSFYRFIDPKNQGILKESLAAPDINCTPDSLNTSVRIADQDFRIETLIFYPEVDSETEKAQSVQTRALCLVVGLKEAPYWKVVSETLRSSIPILISIVVLLVISLLVLISGLTKDLLKLTSALQTANFGGTHAFPVLPKANTEEVKVIVDVLQDLHNQAAEVYREMWLFLGRAAHQIKTPVTAMQATLEVLLRKERTKDELLSGLEDVKSAAALLNGLTRKLISSSRVSFQEAPPKEVVELKKFFTEQIAIFRSQANAKQISIELGTYTEIGVMGNALLMADIFGNLIENAIIYSAKTKGTKIILSWVQVHDKVLIEVADEGPGFPKDIVATLFEPFVRGDEREIPGSGLGLSIAKKSAVLMNGDIELKESTAEGTKIVVTLPFANGKSKPNYSV